MAIQNSALTIIMHYSRVSVPPSHRYSAATAVLMNEILKGAISLIIALIRTDISAYDLVQAPLLSGQNSYSQIYTFRLRKLWKEVWSPDCWKLSIPAILYGKNITLLNPEIATYMNNNAIVIQNNLQYVAASNLVAATFQVTYQMKILTTAAFSVLLLRKKLFSNQWLSLLFLAIGVGVVQIQGGVDNQLGVSARASTALLEMNGMKGFLAVVAACFTSGLAGVYFEMVLKNSQTDLWIRNVQLSLFSLLPALAPIIFTQNGSGYDAGKGFISSLFNNFGAWAWATVFVQVLGGLVTAMVIKYSDNILKGFATSLSIVISFLASVALFDFKITITFILGSAIVLIATWLYNQHSSSLVNIVISKEQWPWMKLEKSKEDISTPQFSDSAVASSTSSLVSLSSLSGGTPAMSDSESRPFIR